MASILADLFILFVRLKQPAVIGELLAGILIGPFVLGWVGTADPVLVAAFHDNPIAAQEALDLVLDIFAELGVVMLLFFVGLEMRLSDLIGVGWRVVLVGTLGIVVPFVAGYGLLVLWGHRRRRCCSSRRHWYRQAPGSRPASSEISGFCTRGRHGSFWGLR